MKGSHGYEALDGQSDTTAIPDRWDMEQSHCTHHGQSSRWTTFFRWRWVIDTTLLFVIIGLLIDKTYTQAKSHRFELGSDITGFAPRFAEQIVTFKPEARFVPENASDFWSKDTQDAWLNLVPAGLGYLSIPNDTVANLDNLPHPIHDYPDLKVYTTSMTHQLHCLYSILHTHNELKLAVGALLANNVSTNQKELGDVPWHVGHCFDYLRQSIMCAADVALEGAATAFPTDSNGKDRGGSDGWDAKHVCRDYSEVFEYLERWAVNDKRWIA